jgi:hypothetical protein
LLTVLKNPQPGNLLRKLPGRSLDIALAHAQQNQHASSDLAAYLARDANFGRSDPLNTCSHSASL